MNIETRFRHAFGAKPAASRFTPGRVNLIGEHTDYNGGYVLPVPLDLGVSAALAPRDDAEIHIVSEGFDQRVTRKLEDLPAGHWSDYVLGAVVEAKQTGWLNGGVNIALSSTLPIGSGLSSSSAVIVGIIKLARTLSVGYSGVLTAARDAEIAVKARCVETDFIGMPCGIMDQMVIALAQPRQALFLDTRSLDYSMIKLPHDPVLQVLHSGVHRKLADGHYKTRKEECDRVKAIFGRRDICRADLSDLRKITDSTLMRRARHLITEHIRTESAVLALKQFEYGNLGALMTESHASMRDDFGITTPEIDALVETAVNAGALGARMTGGGFGGCVVALVPKVKVNAWKDHVLREHINAFSVC